MIPSRAAFDRIFSASTSATLDEAATERLI